MIKHILRVLQGKVAKNYILNSNDEEITEIINAVKKRYSTNFPDWEVGFLSLPRNPLAREKTLLDILEFYRNHPKI